LLLLLLLAGSIGKFGVAVRARPDSITDAGQRVEFMVGPTDAAGVRSLSVTGRIGEPAEEMARKVPSDGAVSAVSTVVDAGTIAQLHTLTEIETNDPSGGGFITNNNTDIGGAGVKALSFKLPKGTSDAQGIAECVAVCANHSECGAYVFVSENGPIAGGPRCAIKVSAVLFMPAPTRNMTALNSCVEYIRPRNVTALTVPC
jgi:hypothetical protein